MEKFTSLLAVFTPADELMVRARAQALAAHFGAEVSYLAIEPGAAPAHERTLEQVARISPDLVIKRPAGENSLRRFGLGENDWLLANECPVPLLLLRGQAWGSPVRLAAAVDVSDDDHTDLARGILHAAGFLALGMHARLDVLYSEVEMHDESLRMERAVKLARLVREFHVGCERIQMFSGHPGQRLPPLLAARHYGVLVLGGRSRRQGWARLARSTLSRMVEATDSDVLLVNVSRPADADAGITARAANAPATAARLN